MANKFCSGRADETGELVGVGGEAEAVGVAGAVDTSSLVTRLSVRAMCCEDVAVPPTDQVALCARMERNGLVAAECAARTGGRPDADGIARGARVDLVERAAFVHHGVAVIARASSFEALVEQVRISAAAGIDADRFRIDVHDPARRLPLGSTDVAVVLADVIPNWPDLRDPLHRFVVIAGADMLLFGEVVAAADAGYRRHDTKPWTTSSSLDSRFARGLINLVPDARSILDPCCGAGSIVIEAASLGLEAFGVDWKTPLVGMTRENLAHFGYDGTVVQADSRTHEQPVDAVVTDVPYGHAIDSDEGEIRAIIEQCSTMAPRGVFVAPADITKWLDAADYTDIEVHTVMKRRGFTRWIHVARSTRA
jgi:predicted RNA methylase